MQGFDDDTIKFQFMDIDPERVGLENIEVPQVCDFGDNQLDYMKRRQHRNVDWNTGVKDDDCIIDQDLDKDGDECDAMSDCSSSSEDSTASIKSDQNDYNGILPAKFVAFLKS